MKIFNIWVILMAVTFTGTAQYYNGLDTSLRCGDFKTALHNHITANTTVRSYDDLIGAHATYDIHKSDDGLRTIIWDMYSDNPSGAEPYEYLPISSDRCGTYDSEGDCYNREHSTPASWYGDKLPMYTDFFNLVPADGYVNGERSNWPMAKVGTASWTSLNGSKVGTSATTGISGTVFEPRNEYKGDFARIFLYMSVRYEDVIGTLMSGNGSSIFANSAYPSFKSGAIQLYIQWHNQDPPSAKEVTRNNGGQIYQGNRNPFVDHPEWVYKIWGTTGSCPPLTQPCTAPLAVNNIGFSSVTASSLQGSFTPVSASGYIVILSQGAFSGSLTNGIIYTANQIIGNGKVIQVGTSNSFNVAALNANTSYTITVFAYNNTSCTGGPVYSTKASASTTTSADCVAPASPISNLILLPTDQSISLAFTAAPDADSYLIVYSTDGITFTPVNATTYVQGNVIGNDIIAGVTTDTTTIISGLSSNTQYYVSVYAFNSCSGLPQYHSGSVEAVTSTVESCFAPSTSPSTLTFSNITQNSLSGSFFRSALGADGYIVIYNSIGYSSLPTPTNGISYNISTDYGTFKVAAVDNIDAFDLSALNSNTRYYFKVFAYNHCGGSPKYNATSADGNILTLVSTPVKVNTQKSFQIYPNPLIGNELIVKSNTLNMLSDIICTDINGRNIQCSYTTCGNDELCVFFDHIDTGIYLLQLQGNGEFYTNKFIVIK